MEELQIIRIEAKDAKFIKDPRRVQDLRHFSIVRQQLRFDGSHKIVELLFAWQDPLPIRPIHLLHEHELQHSRREDRPRQLSYSADLLRDQVFDIEDPTNFCRAPNALRL